jgi:hypothetical protein
LEYQKYDDLAAIAVKEFIKNPTRTDEWAKLFEFQDPGNYDNSTKMFLIHNINDFNIANQTIKEKRNEIEDFLNEIRPVKSLTNDSMAKSAIQYSTMLNVQSYFENLPFIGDEYNGSNIASFSPDGKQAILLDNTVVKVSDIVNAYKTTHPDRSEFKLFDAKEKRDANIDKIVSILENELEKMPIADTKENDEKFKNLIRHYIAIESKIIADISVRGGGKRRSKKFTRKNRRFIRRKSRQLSKR